MCVLFCVFFLNSIEEFKTMKKRVVRKTKAIQGLVLNFFFVIKCFFLSLKL